jgi:hypothetical protein
MLTVLSSFAQEESKNASDNLKYKVNINMKVVLRKFFIKFLIMSIDKSKYIIVL